MAPHDHAVTLADSLPDESGLSRPEFVAVLGSSAYRVATSPAQYGVYGRSLTMSESGSIPRRSSSNLVLLSMWRGSFRSIWFIHVHQRPLRCNDSGPSGPLRLGLFADRADQIR